MTFEKYNKSIFTTTIKECVRCGREHKNIPIYELLNPSDDYLLFTLCPITGQPILIKVV